MSFHTWRSRARRGAPLAALVAFTLATAGAIPERAAAQQDPNNCSAASVSLTVGVFYSDGITAVGGDVITECASLVYTVTLQKGPDPTGCAFEGGSLTITTPDGMVHVVASGAGIPCQGGNGDNGSGCILGQPPVTGSVSYAASAGDIVGGFLTATANYNNGLLFQNSAPPLPVVFAGVGKATAAVLCPDDGLVCNGTETCDPAVVNGTSEGHCVASPPPVCPTAACRDAVCVEPGGCTLVNKPDSTSDPLCTDTDNDVCTIPGCEAGACVQSHTTSPNPACLCGDGIITAPETCDPPGSPGGVNGNVCRADCSVCGDGIVQAGETCDDGNTVDGSCRGGPRDNCRNNCTKPVCGDPTTIKFKSGLDKLTFLGRIEPVEPFDPRGVPIEFVLRKHDGTILYTVTLPAGQLAANRPLTIFKFRDRDASTVGGLKEIAFRKHGIGWIVWLEAWGDLSAADTPNMDNQIAAGSEQFSVDGVWWKTANGWRLTIQGSTPR